MCMRFLPYYYFIIFMFLYLYIYMYNCMFVSALPDPTCNSEKSANGGNKQILLLLLLLLLLWNHEQFIHLQKKHLVVYSHCNWSNLVWYIWIKVHVLLFKYACLNLISSIKAPNLWAPLERAQVMANVKKIEIYNVDFKLKAPKVTNINLLPY